MNRLVFANQLRGLAALSVACSHLVAVFWLMRDFVGSATFSPVQAGPAPALVGLVSFTWFNFGPFGVGLFFLISGLVIPISLEKHTPGTFALARLLRIYPTYAAALGLQLAVLYAASLYWDRPFAYGAWLMLSNALLINDLVGQPSLDLVNWTLCVELKFYLLIALLARQIRAGSLATVLGAGAALCAACALLGGGWLGGAPADPLSYAYTLSAEALFMVFMLIGVLFNFHLRGLLGTAGLAGGIGALLALFALAWQASAVRAQYPVVTANYLYALGLFALLYALRGWVRANPALDLMAAVSFPFYLIHSLLGYSILKLLIVAADMGYPAALAVTLTVLLLVAWTLHVTVEQATIRMGRRLAAGKPGVARSHEHVIEAGSSKA